MLKLIARKAYTRRDYARAKDLFYMQMKVKAPTMVLQPVQKAIGIQLFVCVCLDMLTVLCEKTVR